MISLVAEETRSFMNCLIKTDAFDRFLIHNFSIDTLYNLSIDGTINSEYLSSDEKEIYEDQNYIPYSEIKPILTNILKQSHTPTGLKITFILNPKSTEEIQRRIVGDTEALPVNGFLINLVFDGEKVRVTTGTNYAQFTLDKSVEQSFDQMIRQFFKKNEVLMLEA